MGSQPGTDSLEFNNNFWRDAVNALDEVVFVLDENNTILDCNSAAEKFLKTDKSNIVGRKCHSLVHNCDESVAGCPFERMKKSLKRETFIMSEGGSYFEVVVDPIGKESGGGQKAIHTLKNVTAKIKTDERLRFLSLVAENVHDSIIVFSAGFKITYVNQATLDLFGYSEDELLDKDMDIFNAEPFPDHVSKEIADVVSRGDIFENIILCKRKDESVFHNEVRLSPMRDSSGKIVSYVCVNRDITELIEAEKIAKRMESHEKDALIGRIAGKAAHDFNNVLGIIMGTSQLLLMENLPNTLKQEIEIIKDSASHGREITRNLVFFAKDQEPKVSLFDINEKIRNILHAMRTELEGIKMNISFENEKETLLGDPALIQNAVLNLIKNSIDALSLSNKPEIAVKTWNDTECAHVEIKDNGCGIPLEHHKNIFDPAFTLKGGSDYNCSYQNGIRGSGYGLSNVKKCLDKHRGKIEFESEEGKGSVFLISIPIVREHLDVSKIKSLRKVNIVQNKRVLIVEDEPHLARVLTAVLSKFNHSIDIALNGKTAMEMIEKNDYDVISLDFLLPDMDGMDIYNKIRGRDKVVPIIFVSGNFEFMKSISSLKQKDSNVGHLAKPFDNVDYLKKINKWLAR